MWPGTGSQSFIAGGGVLEEFPLQCTPKPELFMSSPFDTDPPNHGSRFARTPSWPVTAGGVSQIIPCFRCMGCHTWGSPKERQLECDTELGTRLPPRTPRRGLGHRPLLIDWKRLRPCRWGWGPDAKRGCVHTHGRHDRCPGLPRPRSAVPIHLGLNMDVYRRTH